MAASRVANRAAFPRWADARIAAPSGSSIEAVSIEGSRPVARSPRTIPTIPGELFAKFQTSFYAEPKDAVFKALGVQ